LVLKVLSKRKIQCKLTFLQPSHHKFRNKLIFCGEVGYGKSIKLVKNVFKMVKKQFKISLKLLNYGIFYPILWLLVNFYGLFYQHLPLFTDFSTLRNFFQLD